MSFNDDFKIQLWSSSLGEAFNIQLELTRFVGNLNLHPSVCLHEQSIRLSVKFTLQQHVPKARTLTTWKSEKKRLFQLDDSKSYLGNGWK